MWIMKIMKPCWSLKKNLKPPACAGDRGCGGHIAGGARGSELRPTNLGHWPCLPAQVIVAVEDTVRVVDANEALPSSIFEGPILR